jgi:hypothetical protein
MDPCQHSEFEGIGLANLKRAGYLDIVDFQEIPSYQYLARLAEERLTIDFAFIDGSHLFDYVFVDFFLIDKLLRPGGIVILDDLSWPSVRSVCRYVLSNLRYQCIGPQSQGLPERTALRNAASRVHKEGIGPLLRAPLRHIIAPAWRILMWRAGQLVNAPVRYFPGSRSSLMDSQLNLPYHSNYVALQKLADGYWTRHERPLSSTVFLVDVDLPTDH